MIDKRRATLLEMKRTAGLASADEIRVLDNMPVVLGKGLVVPRAARTPEEWLRRFGDITVPLWEDSQ